MNDERFRARAREILQVRQKGDAHVLDEKLDPKHLVLLLAADAQVVARLKRLAALLEPAEGEGATEVRTELALLDLALEELDAQFVALVADLAADLACESHDCLERGKQIELLHERLSSLTSTTKEHG